MRKSRAKSHSTLAATVAAAALLISVSAVDLAFGQSGGGGGGAGATGGAGGSGMAGAGTAAGTAGTEIGAARPADLIGKTLIGADGERIGDVKDVVVENGRVKSVVLDIGNYLGMGPKSVAVPAEQLRLQGERITAVDLTKDSLAKMPDYKK